MKRLPIGIQSFVDLRRNNYLYVDKTQAIFQLITTGKTFFLSRPRRFGKSLLISTIEAVFKGWCDLFEGLYIADKWDWEQQFPVLRFDFAGVNSRTTDNLICSLFEFINMAASNYGVELKNTTLNGRFGELIARLHQLTGCQVVVLADEYDKPITENLSHPEIAESNREALHDFYQVLKASDDHLRFVLLTGVSKFAGVSVFSCLNNLNDITLDDKYASICGYTQQELENYFTTYIDGVVQKMALSEQEIWNEIRVWYNGYSWDGKTSVYNPFSTLLFFDKQQFDNYWFRSGTPTFLIELLKKNNQISPVLAPTVVDSSLFDSFDIIRTSGLSLLFQTGYLTVKQKDLILGRPQYTLDIPNSEVRESRLKYFLSAYSYYPVECERELRSRMQQQLLAHDSAGLEQSLREMLAYIPYPLHIDKEAYYHSLFLLWLKLLGFEIQAEVATNLGRIDAVWKFPGHTIIVEIKYQSKKEKISVLLDKAIKQIKEKQYVDRFNNGQTISLVAIAFAGKETGCRIVFPD
jgi:hypothetical protein